MEPLRPQQITVPTSDTKSVHCGKCGGRYFRTVFSIRKIPAIHPQNPTGKNLYSQEVLAMCVSCGRATPLDEHIEEKEGKH